MPTRSLMTPHTHDLGEFGRPARQPGDTRRPPAAPRPAPGGAVGRVLALQRSAGNHAVATALAARRPRGAAAALQRTLTIERPPAKPAPPERSFGSTPLPVVPIPRIYAGALPGEAIVEAISAGAGRAELTVLGQWAADLVDHEFADWTVAVAAAQHTAAPSGAAPAPAPERPRDKGKGKSPARSGEEEEEEEEEVTLTTASTSLGKRKRDRKRPRIRQPHKGSEGESDSEDPSIGWRSLRSDEDPWTHGLKPPADHDPEITARQHVNSGSKAEVKSAWVSSSRSRKVAAAWASDKAGGRVAQFRIPDEVLSEIAPENERRFYDLTDDADLNEVFPRGGTGANAAKGSQEQLIRGGVPRDAIIIVLEAKKISQRDYSGLKRELDAGRAAVYRGQQVYALFKTRSKVTARGKPTAPLPRVLLVPAIAGGGGGGGASSSASGKRKRGDSEGEGEGESG